MSCLFLTESISPLIERLEESTATLHALEAEAAYRRDQRNSLVRRALAARVPQSRIAEATGLTQPRIAQIKKGIA